MDRDVKGRARNDVRDEPRWTDGGDVARRTRSDVPTNQRMQEWAIGSGRSTKESVEYSEDVMLRAVVADYATWRSRHKRGGRKKGRRKRGGRRGRRRRGGRKGRRRRGRRLEVVVLAIAAIAAGDLAAASRVPQA